MYVLDLILAKIVGKFMGLGPILLRMVVNG